MQSYKDLALQARARKHIMKSEVSTEVEWIMR